MVRARYVRRGLEGRKGEECAIVIAEKVQGRCVLVVFFFSSRRRHTSFDCDWSSDVCSSDLQILAQCGKGPGSGEAGGFVMNVSALRGEGRRQQLAAAISEKDPDRDRRLAAFDRSEERRVGKEGRSRWRP